MVELEVSEAEALPVFTKEFDRVFSTGTLMGSYKQACSLLNKRHEYAAMRSVSAIFALLDTILNEGSDRSKDYN